MGLPFFHVDAFTDRAFGGNPAAVYVLKAPRTIAWMQKVAGEMNLSETAFAVMRNDGGFDLRWFTPTTEVDLCGHATLASAHVLWERRHVPIGEAIRFETKSGRLSVRRIKGGWIEMDFPSEPDEPVLPPDALLAALSETPIYVGRNRIDYIAQLDNAELVRMLTPDPVKVAMLGGRGLIVTAEGRDTKYDFISRFFAPQAGIPEDPVTGSAHCCLGPFWQKRLGKDLLTGYQASARGGEVRVVVGSMRVLISGMAVTVAEGQLFA